MSNLSPFDLHALRLGKLLGNLQSIETAVRIFLYEDDRSRGNSTQRDPSVSRLKANDWAEWSPLTDNRSLQQVLDLYNSVARDRRIDVDRIVQLRDALAHGRVFGHGPIQTDNTFMLLKFNRKKINGRALVTLAEDMTEEWFDENLSFLQGAIENIRLALDWQKVDLNIRR